VFGGTSGTSLDSGDGRDQCKERAGLLFSLGSTGDESGRSQRRTGGQAGSFELRCCMMVVAASRGRRFVTLSPRLLHLPTSYLPSSHPHPLPLSPVVPKTGSPLTTPRTTSRHLTLTYWCHPKHHRYQSCTLRLSRSQLPTLLFAPLSQPSPPL
jgi:hypothetical protein